jgi:DNA (cytosine-5)-methyltransferase 1
VSAYYNEIDPYAAQWLRNLIAGGHIAAGEVDTRSIIEVRADDLRGFTQCHFFAGIAGWSLALRLAGWPDDRPVWTGSCPCQPYSTAKMHGTKGANDSRDLWPDFFRLIRERFPAIIFGEQVAAAIQWGWWDRTGLDLESENYSVAAAVLRADCVGAAHQRKRLYWLGYANGTGLQRLEHDECPFSESPKAQSIICDTFIRARSALAGNFRDLLPTDGIPLSVERLATKAYGNAIVPQVAAEFIKATIHG